VTISELSGPGVVVFSATGSFFEQPTANATMSVRNNILTLFVTMMPSPSVKIQQAMYHQFEL